ncbi:MAG TPA: hypothetical protein VFQ53_29745 [Kofleriaceae bacterium]|nr:hypothetical protein [Kofleriaceae bacterium]
MPRKRGHDEVRHAEPSEGTQPENPPTDAMPSQRAASDQPHGKDKQRHSKQAKRTHAGGNRDRKRTS